MKVKCFHDTDTVLVEFSEAPSFSAFPDSF